KIEEDKTQRASPRTTSSGQVDGVQIDIDYGSPFVKDRTIWGELVPYDKVWRAGADEATAITFGSDVLFVDAEIKAGTYALFIKPQAESDWQIILNEEWSQEEHGVWGAYNHDPTKDVARIDIAPELLEQSEESLQYAVLEDGIKFAWEKVAITIGIKAKSN
ncbi:DUF2911 domain-containing protein, partial [Crocinitomix catalasitica]|nr:DUF2911 domain-containing protein [Crocinitomix catalasitica]